MLVEGCAFFLAVAILFYCLFAGADFGAGILEAFRGRKRREDQRALITHAIGPVWEANHVWLILAIVILFVGFPKAYAEVSTVFHIPLTLMLFGIVLRGCAFTFRHYDAVKDGSQKIYSWIFVVSSFLTPFALGTVAGALFLGKRVRPPGSFADAYVLPWANAFSFSVGVFACVLFAFLAAVYLIGESEDREIKAIFVTRAKVINVLAVVSGAAVFLTAEQEGLGLISGFASDPLALASMGLATLLLAPLWLWLERKPALLARTAAASQVALILIGWLKLQYPALIRDPSAGGTSFALHSVAAPEATLEALLWALVIGSSLIFPALLYLMKVFKHEPDPS